MVVAVEGSARPHDRAKAILPNEVASMRIVRSPANELYQYGPDLLPRFVKVASTHRRYSWGQRAGRALSAMHKDLKLSE